MAAPTIKIKRSAVSGNAPTTAQLELGELALNTYDGKLFTEINTGSPSIVEIGSNLNTLSVNTITSNVSFTADATFTGDDYNVVWDKSDSSLEFADNAKLSFGASSDLQLYHNGNHSRILDSGTGKLQLGSDTQVEILNGAFSVPIAQFNAGGSVVLRNNNTTRFETTSIGVNVTGHSELDNIKSVGIATFSNNAIHANIYSTGISTISGFRFPTTDGDEDQALVTDGNGSLSFKTLSGGGGGATGAATTISAGVTTATQGQTVFTTAHPHNDGTTTRSVQVFINGIKQRPSGAGNATKDFTASSNSTITLENGATLGDEVRTIVYYNHTLDEEYFTATQGQTLFTLTGSSAAQKFFRVYVNGAKMRNGTDYGVAAPVTFVSPCAVGDNVEIVCDDAEDAFTATDQQVSFTPTATSITEDNMQVFINGVQQTPTVDYSIGDPAVTFIDASGLNVGDQVDVCIRRS
tara:strand:- start:4351 stop:5745 length:1395 start_codon:yes stop_codon:yes gene_type:complete